MKNKLILVAAALLSLSAGMLFKYYQIQQTVQQPASPLLSIRLPDSEGKLHDLSEWQGKILIINFWATWCPPCLKEIPEFIRLQDELRGKGIQFIGIAIEDQASIVSFLQKTPINYPVLIGGDAAISLSQQLGNLVNAVPFTLIVDSQGMIVHRHPGELSRQKLMQIVNPLLAEN